MSDPAGANPPTPPPSTPPPPMVDYVSAPVVAPPHPGGHETSDVNVRPMAYAVIALIAVAIVIHVGLYFLFGAYDRQERAQRTHAPRTSVQMPAQAPPPDAPRLQGIPGFHTNTPRADMAVMNERNAIILNTYGPTTRPGLARIPVDRAMELMLQNNAFKSRPAATKPAVSPPAGAAGAQPQGGGSEK